MSGEITGNTPAEALWRWFDQVGRAYFAEFGRPPTVEELKECFRFCITPIENGQFEYDTVLGQWVRPKECA